MKKQLKKILGIVMCAALMLTAICGCKSDNDSKGSDTTALTGKVATDGSTSMEKVIGFLSEAFQEKNNGVTVSYNPTGSSSGITAVKEGSCDIGLSSRDLKDSEKDGLIGTVVAIDGIAIVVNPNNPIADLTVEQIAALYTGEITNWSEIGGNDSPVVLIGREPSSGTRDGFESITKTAEKCKYNQELTSTGDVIQTVASNPNAIGYASLASVNDTVKAVKVNGVAPTTETVQNGSYKIQRNFVFVTRANEELSAAAKAFFEFATSGEADQLIIKAGAVPVKH